MPAATMLYSVLLNSSTPERIHIYAIDGGVSDTTKSRLSELVSSRGARIEWIPAPGGLNVNLPKDTYYTITTYYRIHLPHIIPYDIDKIIYLDIDLVVEGDLAELWELEIGDNFLLAARDGDGFSIRSLGHITSCPGAFPLLDIEYFNAGVMVVNAPKWRESDLTEKLSRFVHAWPNHLKFADQDALNVVIQEGRGQLDPKWNQGIPTWVPMSKNPLSPNGIVHYIGPNKPWLGSATYSSSALFDHYLLGSGWLTPAEWRAYKLKKHLVGIKHRLAYYLSRAGKTTRRLTRRAAAMGRTMFGVNGGSS